METPRRRGSCVKIAVLMAILALLGAAHVEAGNSQPRGRRCHSDSVCRGGTCNDAGRCCVAGDLACGSTCCNPLQAGTCCGDSYCTDLDSDDANCGGCGITCGGGKTCQSGACACPSGQTECNGVCVDTTSDDANCGACGDACEGDLTCSDSQCRCASSGLPCSSRCVDSLRDPDNCGACGNVCGAGEQCLSGQCATECPPCEEAVDNICVVKEPGKEFECNGTCVDILNDPNNCGSCGRVCPPGRSCEHGECGLCPTEPLDYEECPVNDPGGHVIAVCCRPETPNCCFGSRGGGGCCADSESCCLTNIGDGYCCPAGTQCCASSTFYPCLPAGAECS